MKKIVIVEFCPEPMKIRSLFNYMCSYLFHIIIYNCEALKKIIRKSDVKQSVLKYFSRGGHVAFLKLG